MKLNNTKGVTEEDVKRNIQMDSNERQIYAIQSLARQMKREENKLFEREDLTIREIDDFIKKVESNMSDNNALALIERIKELERQSKRLENELNVMQRQEMNRIFHEILRYDYERRFNTKKEMVFSCLVGEENIQNEINRFVREKYVGLFI